jgi:hypothetical protein
LPLSELGNGLLFCIGFKFADSGHRSLRGIFAIAALWPSFGFAGVMRLSHVDLLNTGGSGRLPYFEEIESPRT